MMRVSKGGYLHNGAHCFPQSISVPFLMTDSTTNCSNHSPYDSFTVRYNSVLILDCKTLPWVRPHLLIVLSKVSTCSIFSTLLSTSHGSKTAGPKSNTHEPQCASNIIEEVFRRNEKDTKETERKRLPLTLDSAANPRLQANFCPVPGGDWRDNSQSNLPFSIGYCISAAAIACGLSSYICKKWKRGWKNGQHGKHPFQKQSF